MSQLTVNLADPVLSRVRTLAERHHLSVEEYVAQLVAEAVRSDALWNELASRGRRVPRDRFEAILNKAPDVPPLPGDEEK